MIYRLTFAYPQPTAGGISGYGFYADCPSLEDAQALAARRCSAAAVVESVTLAAPRYQESAQ